MDGSASGSVLVTAKKTAKVIQEVIFTQELPSRVVLIKDTSII